MFLIKSVIFMKSDNTKKPKLQPLSKKLRMNSNKNGVVTQITRWKLHSNTNCVNGNNSGESPQIALPFCDSCDTFIVFR